MKNISFLVLTTILLSCFALSWQKQKHFEPQFVINTFNDGEIITLNSGIEKINIKTNTIESGTLNGVNGIIIKYFINTDINMVGFLTESTIITYDYKSMETVSSFDYDRRGDVSDINVSFSSDGKYVYTFERSDLELCKYETKTGKKVDEFIINSNPIFYNNSFLNGYKDEFALGIGDSLEIWSIESETKLRKIPFNPLAQNFSIIDKGNALSYSIGIKLIIANYSDGNEYFSRQFKFTYSITNIVFTSNLRYVICQSEHFENCIYDIKADSLVKLTELDSIQSSSNRIEYKYLDSNLTKCFGYEMYGFWCGRYAEMPVAVPVYFIYDIKNQKRVTSVYNGFVGNINNVLLSDNNDLMVTYGEYNDSYIVALLNTKGDFIKYIDIDAEPTAITPDSKYIVFKKLNKLFFYNIPLDTIEREFTWDQEKYFTVFFPGTASNRMIFLSDSFYIYKYDDFTLLNTVNYKNIKLSPFILRCDINGNMYYSATNRLFKLDYYSGKTVEIPLANTPKDDRIQGMTPDGKHLLYLVGYDSIMVYSVDKQRTIYSLKVQGIYNPYQGVAIAFMGNYQAVYFKYMRDPIYQTIEYFVVNVADGASGNLAFDDSGPIFSKDGNYYATYTCPGGYSYNQVPIIASINEEPTNNYLYLTPNPASDYIEISTDNVILSEAKDPYIRIYDLLGVEFNTPSLHESSPYQGGETVRIDISGLVPGVYFVRVGDVVKKFIKV